jgi:phospho-N-acetylmuramoyl-pentapeptide-transferase
VTALALSIVFGPCFIKKLAQLKVGQKIRKDEAPDLHKLHKRKEGTPTMGGLLIIFSTLAATLLWADLSNRLVWTAVAAMVWMGTLGFVDDYIKLARQRSMGLRATWKLLFQILFGLLLGCYLYCYPVSGEIGTKVDVLFLKNVWLNLGWLYVPFVIVTIVGASNAVNLTDGLDGLAIGSVTMAALAYTAVAYIVGRADWTSYLLIWHVPLAWELTVFGAALLGAGLGFLWFNSHPAEVFMGDTGSLALGGALATVAILVKQEMLLIIVGGLFVVEALSVILQVASFKLWGKRVFLMSPLHHHFELKGWSETKVTVRFWIIAAIFAMMSLSVLKVR